MDFLKLEKLLTGTIASSTQLPQVVELKNFGTYGRLFDETGGKQSKSAKDLAEMRFMQIVTQALTDLQQRGQTILLVITCEKNEELSSLTCMQFKHKFKLDLPERNERATILSHLIQAKNKAWRDIDCFELAKYLQGKTFKDLKQIVTKLVKRLS